MIDYHLDPATAVLTIRPESALEKGDFAEIARSAAAYHFISGRYSLFLTGDWTTRGVGATALRFEEFTDKST